MRLDSRTRAILRSAEFGFLGVIVRTWRQTPRFCGAPGMGSWRWRRLFQFLRMAGALTFVDLRLAALAHELADGRHEDARLLASVTRSDDPRRRPRGARRPMSWFFDWWRAASLAAIVRAADLAIRCDRPRSPHASRADDERATFRPRTRSVSATPRRERQRAWPAARARDQTTAAAERSAPRRAVELRSASSSSVVIAAEERVGLVLAVPSLGPSPSPRNGLRGRPPPLGLGRAGVLGRKHVVLLAEALGQLATGQRLGRGAARRLACERRGSPARPSRPG